MATVVKETFFISHGSPALSIDDTIPARNFLKSFRSTVHGQKPSAILVISAHWETAEPTVNVVSGVNDTIHDFHNFPKQMYELQYPAAGAPKLARRVKELLEASGMFDCVAEDETRGLDHGAWVPLMLMYPEAEIPVCQLSVQPERDGSYHYMMGKALRGLKEEGVLIMGSGSATHNLRTINRSHKNAPVVPWALEFDTWLTDALLQGRYKDVNNYEEKAPHAKLAHPWPEHIFPLHVALGAAGEHAKTELIFQDICGGTLSYSSYKFATINI